VNRLRDARVRLFLTSAALLVCELLLIRWTPDHLLHVGFFSNFILIASFLGIGSGILLGSRGRRWHPWVTAMLLLVLVTVVSLAQPALIVNSADQLFFGTAADQIRNALTVAAVVVLAAGVMASLAMPLGPLLRAMPPLQAYAIDIVGSLTGIAVVFVLALLWTPPLISFGVLAALLVPLAPGSASPRIALLGANLAAVLILVGVEQASGETWSPYNRIGNYRSYFETVNICGQDRRYGGLVNVVAVGGILDESLWEARFLENSFYDEVFRLFPGRQFNQELIIGAGGGDDVAVALRNDVGHIDAVEIDPVVISRVGARHPDNPYADPRVRAVVNDGRAFIRQSDDRYDLIVLAQSGSRAAIAARAGLRVESYLWTKESYATIRDHLTADGVFVVYYVKGTDHANRVAATITAAFGQPPLVRTCHHDFTDAYVEFAGPATQALRSDPGVHQLSILQPPTDLRIVTDDWPFPFLPPRGLDPVYPIGVGLLAGFAAVTVGGIARTNGRSVMRGLSPHFFVLGAAFLLLETRSIAVFSLLFGTTWLVNTLVFFAILLSVLLAIGMNARWRLPRRSLYLGLFLAVAVNYVLSPASLLFDPLWLRYLVAATLAFSPVFFANLVFAFSFRDTRQADLAFASNLLGAVLGGLAEWGAVITGYRELILGVGALYVLAYLLSGPLRFGADKDLARG